MPGNAEDAREQLIVQILRQLKRHPQYHVLFLEQARELSASSDIDFGANRREQMAQLERMIPDQSYRLSSDRQVLHRRVAEFRRLRQDDPDSEHLLSMVAIIFVRLDAAENCNELVATVQSFGTLVHPVLEQIVESVGPQTSDAGRSGG